MNLDDLKREIERRHGGTATLIQSVPVAQPSKVNDQVVQVYSLADHPTATRVYAWSGAVDGSKERRYFAVLHDGAISSPNDAVQAANAAEPSANDQ